MFIEKIKHKKTGILLYGITPPKAHNSQDKNIEIAEKTLKRIQTINADGLVIYDLQDESTRTSASRPFPFLPTVDPYIYASEFLKDLQIPKIIYRSVGKYDPKELSQWVSDIQDKDFASVFVGAPSKNYNGKIKLDEAYEIWKNENTSSFLGAVSIFERHNINKSEHLTILKKMEQGCSFFITQCVFNVGYAKDVLSELYYHCIKNDLQIPTIIFTLTTCGSKKTLDFMDWLGIHFPGWLRNELYHSNDILSRSIDLSLDIADEMMDFCIAKSIPFGINIESVSIRKEEIEASIDLYKRVEAMLQLKLLPALLKM